MISHRKHLLSFGAAVAAVVWRVVLGLVVLAAVAGGAEAFDLKSWNNKIDNATERFKVLREFNNEAVLDKETGLVWERSPASGPYSWAFVSVVCYTSNVGGRMGWRGSTVEELTSLVDRSQSNPALPPGHPFQDVQLQDFYWTTTTVESNPEPAFAVAMAVFFSGGIATQLNKLPTTQGFVWCVRGGHGYDGGH